MKRKREELDKIKKKLKKLEKKLEKRRRLRRVIVSDSDTDSNIDSQDEKENEEQPQPLDEVNVVHLLCDELDENNQLIQNILGKDPSQTEAFGKEIQKDLATHMNYIATAGLTKEIRKELLDGHLPPSNCKMIAAPILNPEIKAAITDVVAKRDKAMEAKQKQLGCAISCLTNAITLLLDKDNKDPVVLKLLTDTTRILCDAQHNESLTRRNFILSVLKKELKDQILLTKIDSFLFGQELAETLRTAKAINKSGADLKGTSITKNKPPIPQSLNKNKNLNWKAPVPNRRQQGPPRAKEPAPPRQQHAYSSKPSRPNTSRGRR